MPRAPDEVCERSSESGSSGRSCSARSRLVARARSGAVSASVPSRSRRTASIIAANCVNEVIDVGVAAERIVFGERVVVHAGEFSDVQAGFAAGAGQLGGFDELGVVVRTFGQQFEYVFCA